MKVNVIGPNLTTELYTAKTLFGETTKTYHMHSLDKATWYMHNESESSQSPLSFSRSTARTLQAK